MEGKTQKCLVTLESRQVGHHHHISSPSQQCHVHLFFKFNGQNHSLHLMVHLHKDNGSTCQTHGKNANMPDLNHTHQESTSFAFQRIFPVCFLHFSSLVYSLTSRKRNDFVRFMPCLMHFPKMLFLPPVQVLPHLKEILQYRDMKQLITGGGGQQRESVMNAPELSANTDMHLSKRQLRSDCKKTPHKRNVFAFFGQLKWGK